VLALEAEFGSHVFSADMVARGKPHPDIFLFAAAKLGVRPDECLVIEDSANGIRAAVAAGMAVVGLCAASHIREVHDLKLRDAGAVYLAHSWSDVERFALTFSKASTHALRWYHAGVNRTVCRGMVHHPIHLFWERMS
jgi:beta-phosphoglucomutase-like phosphatase (HAD superfamily)